MRDINSCSVFGHRDAVLSSDEVEELKKVIEDLIVYRNVHIFLFGSRSNFDALCHKIVTELKVKYPFIIRKCYTCSSETCVLESEREYWEEIYSNVKKEKVTLLGMEEEVEHKNKWKSGRASYVERNQAMIDDSNFCIFYYNENYEPQQKYSKRNIAKISKSGTALAYNYAKQKKKILINLFRM